MKAIKITINDIKSIKQLMDEVDALRDRSLTIDGYSFNYGNKKLIIDAKESSIETNVHISASILKVDYDTVISMCYDFDFAKKVINN